MAALKTSLLLIDDDPFFLRLYSSQFMAAGYIVHVAATATEGLSDAKRLKPHFILLDLMLPDGDGLSVLKQLKRQKETAGITVVLLSNVSHPGYREQARSLGAAEYLVKAYYEPSEIVAFMNGLR